MSDLEAAVAAAAYSRHHYGFVRQRQLGTLLAADEPVDRPVPIQLLGEYVIQICRDIQGFARTALPAHPAMQEDLPVFFRENRCFAELTRRRAISYWSCCYRDLFASPDDYPGLAALSMLRGRPAT